MPKSKADINKEACRKYREKNREQINKKASEYYKRKYSNPDALKNRTEKKFKIPTGSIDKMISRQRNRCLITQNEFSGNKRSFYVDHNHETGQVRGLLSNEANSALGYLKEDPEAFYRAVAYLTLDPNKPLIYIMGSLRNEGVEEVAAEVRSHGYDVFDNWFSAGREADDYWQKYSKNKGLSYTEALQSREANHVFRFDKAYLDLCDAAILVMPAGKSGFLELGYLLGRGTPAYLLLDEDTEKNRYDVMPQFANIVTSDLSIILGDIKERTKDFARL